MISKLITKYRELPIQAKAAAWFFACSVLQKGISVITTPIFTRLLTEAEYGKYNVFVSWEQIIAVFVSLRLYYGVYTQGLIKFDKTRDIFSSALQGLMLTMVILWTGIYLLFRNFWNPIFTLSTPQMLAMFLTIWTTAIYSFWAAEQRVILNYKKLVVLTIIVSIMKPVLGILAVCAFEDKVTARIWEIALIELIAYFGLFIVQMKRGKVFFSKKIWKYALGFNIPLIPHYLSQTLLNSADRIMIDKMIGADAAGIYSLAYSISMLMTMINTALLQTVNPWIIKKIKDRQYEGIGKIAYITLGIIAIANLFLICCAPEIVSFFAPKSYHDAIWVIAPIAMSSVFIFAYNLFSNFEFYFEKTLYITISTCIAAIVNIVLNYIFIQMFGYYAAGYTTLICYIIYAAMHYIFMKKICRDNLNGVHIYNTKILALIFLGFMVTGFLTMTTYNYPVIRYSMVVIILLIVVLYRKNLLKFFMSMKLNKV